MDEQIVVGLDFGTHQTKICIRRTPDEGHGEPSYEFFKFYDLSGKGTYFLPSIVQVNDDDTLSYGFVDKSRRKKVGKEPCIEDVELDGDFDLEATTDFLFNKYATKENREDDKEVLRKMLQIRKETIANNNAKKLSAAKIKYEKELMMFKLNTNVYRYFKQATFSQHAWKRSIESRTLCIWFLAYVIFLLEEEFGTNFSINIGIPTDDTTFERKKRLAVEVLASAYYLVEDVYQNDMDEFLNEKIDELKAKTKLILYSDKIKEDYVINVFPEAYASLISLTSKGKISGGSMNLNADIGGGTTDISFFTVPADKSERPIIYKYWSLPCGLNYLAEQSHFDYSDGNFKKDVDRQVVRDYRELIESLINKLTQDLSTQLKEFTTIPISELKTALKDRVIIYNGGGSTYSFLTNPILNFTDVKLLTANVWKEENIIDKPIVGDMCNLLATAYGLSLGKDDKEVKLGDFKTLFYGLHGPERNSDFDNYVISKDQC